MAKSNFRKTKELKEPVIMPIGKSEAQEKYIQEIRNNAITIVYGPAGSGKTFLATMFALSEFLKGNYERIVFTRPYIEACGEKIGALPGDLGQKISPILLPITDILEEKLSREFIDKLIANKQIIMVPLGFIRGATFKKAFVLLDESQSTTPQQMHLFLTRIGEKTKVVITGDLNQSDIKGINGLADAIKRLQNIEGISIVKLDKASIVRHPLIGIIEERYGINHD